MATYNRYYIPLQPIRPMVQPVMQPAPQPNVIVAGSPVVSPAAVFPERYGMPPIGIMPPYPPGPYGYAPYPPGYTPYPPGSMGCFPYGPFDYDDYF